MKRETASGILLECLLPFRCFQMDACKQGPEQGFTLSDNPLTYAGLGLARLRRLHVLSLSSR